MSEKSETTEAASVPVMTVAHPGGKASATVSLPASKSESNRVLIIDALAGGGSELENLSEARDTRTLRKLLETREPTLDVLDAGTTMRFLTAFRTVMGRPAIMTGTDRMRQRPIGPLVEALRDVADDKRVVQYCNREGYPPVRVNEGFRQRRNSVQIQGGISSQFVSALMMIAPVLPDGLNIAMEGEIRSRPYILMTLELMQRFGARCRWGEGFISVAPQPYAPTRYRVESDWSGASYWFAIAALAQDAEIVLQGLRKNSYQGDRQIVDIMEALGVKTEFDRAAQTATLSRGTVAERFEYDFSGCPDLAQTAAVVCAAKGVEASLTGLNSLRLKETDRIAALQNELGKLGAEIEVVGDEEIRIAPGSLRFSDRPVSTYDDHRMAMAFAPLALLHPVKIENPGVVDKSYPGFWEDLKKAGFRMTEVNEQPVA